MITDTQAATTQETAQLEEAQVDWESEISNYQDVLLTHFVEAAPAEACSPTLLRQARQVFHTAVGVASAIELPAFTVVFCPPEFLLDDKAFSEAAIREMAAVKSGAGDAPVFLGLVVHNLDKLTTDKRETIQLLREISDIAKRQADSLEQDG